MKKLSLFSTRTISPTLNEIYIIPRFFIAESAGNFWKPAESENVANLDFKIIKHYQNLGIFL